MITVALVMLLFCSFLGLVISVFSKDEDEYNKGYEDGYDAGWIAGQEYQRVRSDKEDKNYD